MDKADPQCATRLAGMSRRYEEYMPLRAGKPRRRRRFLRTAKLNIVGGVAVVGSCLTSAGLGLAAGRLFGLPVALTAAVGGLLPLALLVAADRRRWRAMLAVHGWGGTAAEVSAVAADLLRRGVVATVETHVDEEGGESASLAFRNADTDVVSTVLVERGLPPIIPWP